MNDLSSALIGIATKIGAPLVKSMLEQKLGPMGGALADAVIGAVASNAGVSVDELPEVIAKRPRDIEIAVGATEEIAPHLAALYGQGLAHQTAIMSAEDKEGPLQSGWRWGWMYFLAFLWFWRLVLLPVVNSATGADIERVDLGIMLTLTSWFIALYMGGHTVKELGKNAIDAVRTWREGASK